MRTQVAVLVLWSCLALLLLPGTAGAYGGGNDGNKDRNNAMSSDMSTGVIGTIFGIPVSVVPFHMQGDTPVADSPTGDIPSLGPMSQSSIEQILSEDLQASIERSEAAGFNVKVWHCVTTGAWVIEWAGAAANFVLAFTPGVNLITNIGLGALNSGTKSLGQGHSLGEATQEAIGGGAMSGILGTLDAGGQVAQSQFSQSVINLAVDKIVGAMLENRPTHSTMPSMPYDRPTYEGPINQPYYH